MALERDDFRFEITESIAVLSTSASGWQKEVNMVRWHDAKPKLDIREWDPDHEHCSRGINLNEAESLALHRVLNERFGN